MARFFRPSLLATAAAIGLSACSSNTDSIQDQVSIGKANFQGFGCATCHTVAGLGGSLGPDLTMVGFRKSSEWLDLWLSSPESWKHNTLMPNFYLKEPARKSIVAYLASLKGEAYADGHAPWNDPALEGDMVKKGQVIFTHAGCAGCHGVGGQGGYPNNNVAGGLIPSLIQASDGYSKEELAEKIIRGVPQSVPADPKAPPPMLHMPTWGEKFSIEEGQALAEYIYSLNPHKEEAW